MASCGIYWGLLLKSFDKIHICLISDKYNRDTLYHGSPNRSPPGGIQRPAATLLEAFEELRRVPINFVISACLSVRPSVRAEQLGSNPTNFHEILYFGIFRKYAEKIKVPSKSDNNSRYFTRRPTHLLTYSMEQSPS
jgi:hypothetical protein